MEMSPEKKATMQQTINIAQGEIDFEKGNPFVTVTLLRDDLQEMLNITKQKMEVEQ